MMTFEEFEQYLFDVSEQIPDQYYKELNGGIMAREECKIHAQSRGDELCIMGEYHRDYGLGCYIVLYYGSFVKQWGLMSDAYWKEQVQKVLEHELTHHLESLAKENQLEVEDHIQLAKYLGIYPKSK